MTLSAARIDFLNEKCHQFRVALIKLLYQIQTGHPGGSLSAVEILTALYYEKLNIQPDNPAYPDRDRFVLGKGHAAPMLYLILAEKGYFSKTEMNTLRQINSRLQGHPCAKMTPGVDLSSGPLGLGISAAVGMAAATKLDNKNLYTYVLMGDGEIQEGIVWEAAMAASKFKLDNLIGIIDCNGVQLDGTVEEIMPLGNLADKWKSFGWRVIETDGHDIQAVSTAIDQAKAVTGQPTMIIAKTVKGKGVSFMEGKNTWHGKPINEQEYSAALRELGVR
ncbi:transketolase [Anaerosporomusa subterranea]|uniref:Transketolase n=1 Tax=Anaerosporomusa subterranea TaxID=1794912 RepID=A0A154BVJ0_ANASB|nr:transketolase [Anaerosporomusa subterranea]KYZ77952.1 transketolase [Anaerosporomusa subterranea]